MKIRQILEEIKYQCWKRTQTNREYKEFCRQVNEQLRKRRQEDDDMYRKKYERVLNPYGNVRSPAEILEDMNKLINKK